MTTTCTHANVFSSSCHGVTVLVTLTSATYSHPVENACAGHAAWLLRYGFVLVDVPMGGERYTTEDDGEAWTPREACEACGMVDSATDRQDADGAAYRLCQACTDDTDGMV